MPKSASYRLTETDRRVLNEIQSDFPLTPRPFQTIAEKLGLSEAEVIETVVHLKTQSIIRRIGGNFVPHKLGYVSTLCAARVPEDQIEAFANVVNRFQGVTHNYQRDGDYNVWFTFIAPSRQIIRQNLEQIALETGLDDILNLPATAVFKIKAEFAL